ncbi:MAG: tetratricopeptide repeat protein [Desulfobacteraceae bacterium]|jgi:TolA-binding protein
MGGKQWKNRKHLLFYGACFLIIILIAEGCIIPPRRVQVLPEGGTPVEHASLMVSKGDYDGALKAYGRIARSYPGDSPGDRALFEMGLIWAYPGNPKKNHEEALKYFKRLLHDFPGSPLREEAGAWAEVLIKISRHDGQTKDLEDKILSCIHKITALKEQISSYEEQIGSYQQQISALKEIDIGIEEKKRKGLPEE